MNTLRIYYTTVILFNSNLATTRLTEVVMLLELESSAIDKPCKTHILQGPGSFMETLLSLTHEKN